MATHTDAVASVYAKSLYELAENAGGEEKITEVGDELESVCELSRQDRDFREFLASPIVNADARGDSLKKMFSNRITDLLLRFLLVLNDKGRLGHLESINAAYDQLVQERFGRVEVDVYTPMPLGEDQRSQIAARIQESIGKQPVIHTYTDPTMLGGIKLRIGDQLIDGSVAAKLRTIRSTLLRDGATAVRGNFDRMIEEGGE